MPIAPSWQASAQSPQPLHFDSSIFIIFLIIVVYSFYISYFRISFPERGFYSILPYFISLPSLSNFLRLPVMLSIFIFHTPVLGRLRSMALSKSGMFEGVCLWHIPLSAVIFSSSSVTSTAVPFITADSNSVVNLSVARFVSPTQDRQTAGCFLRLSIFRPPLQCGNKYCRLCAL